MCRANTTEFTGVPYFLHHRTNCIWSENSRHLFWCYFRSNVNTCLLNSSDMCMQSSQCLVVACTLHLLHTSSNNSWMPTAKRRVILRLFVFWSSDYLSNKFVISFSYSSSLNKASKAVCLKLLHAHSHFSFENGLKKKILPLYIKKKKIRNIGTAQPGQSIPT